MPRIRKKTSKRTTTHQRTKVKQKVAESRNKKKKAAKKNPQWKTRHPKDPGIPNNFPYKDQILAEVAEQRRQNEELKQRKKEEKKSGMQMDTDAEEHPQAGPSSISLSTSAVADEVSSLLPSDLPCLRAVIDKSGVIVEVLDSRDPLSFINDKLEAYIREQDKCIVYVLNKCDLCSRENLVQWAAYLRSRHPTFIVCSSSTSIKPSSKTKVSGSDALGVSHLALYLKNFVSTPSGDQQLRVAFVGRPNVGKSSLINSILRKPVFGIYVRSIKHQLVQTSYAQEMTWNEVVLVDTPGLSFDGDSEQSTDMDKAKDMLLNNKGRIDRVSDPLPGVQYLLSRANTQDLMLFYNLPAFAPGDLNGFLTGIARQNQFVKKGGALDIVNAARIVLRGWNTDSIPFCTAPADPSAPSAASGSSTLAATHSAADDAVLPHCKTRLEMRRKLGLLKLKNEETDKRPVALDAPWCIETDHNDATPHSGVEDGSVPGEASEEEPDEDEEDDDDDVDEEADGSDHEDDVDLPPAAGVSLKRSSSTNVSNFSKKKRVSFASASKPAIASKIGTPTGRRTRHSIKSASKSSSKTSGEVKHRLSQQNAAAGDKELYDFSKYYK